MTSAPLSHDPQTAWEPWQATRHGPWTRRLAAHLYRRAAFGASCRQLDEAVASSPQECVDRLLGDCRDVGAAGAFDAEMSEIAASYSASDATRLEHWWLYRMMFTPAPLLERLTLFWHGHFASSADKVNSAAMMLAQNTLFRRSALGPLEELVQAVSCDPAMLVYLDSTTNARQRPNENYARELMELFCLGPGNYSERDIQETARCFTGWEIRGERFRFNRFQHDFGQKTLFGRTGEFNGDDAVRIILAQDAAPRFFARKIVRFFVCDEPLHDELIEPLARELRKNDFHIEPTVRRVLTSRFFYSEASVGQKIRSPVELAVGTLRSLDGTVGTVALADALRPLGQRLFFPPNVKGWDGGRRWINATTLIGRVNLISKIVREESARFDGRSLGQYVESLGVESAKQLVDQLDDLLAAVPLPVAARDELIALAQSRRVAESAADALCALAAVAEFQLG